MSFHIVDNEKIDQHMVNSRADIQEDVWKLRKDRLGPWVSKGDARRGINHDGIGSDIVRNNPTLVSAASWCGYAQASIMPVTIDMMNLSHHSEKHHQIVVADEYVQVGGAHEIIPISICPSDDGGDFWTPAPEGPLGEDEQKLTHRTTENHKPRRLSFYFPSQKYHMTALHQLRPVESASNEASNDIKYVSAIIRPNITTTDDYIQSLLSGMGMVLFRSFEFDQRAPFTLEEVKEFDAELKAKYPDASTTAEVGLNSKNKLTSLRYIAHNGSELYAALLSTGDALTIHYRKEEAVQALITRCEAKVVIEKPTVTRLDWDGDSIRTSTFTVDPADRIYDEFYPNIEQGATTYIKDYYASSANILLLYGQWGAGKSSLMTGMSLINSQKNRYILIDDPSFYSKPEVFTGVIDQIETNTRDEKTTVIYLEESDDYIKSKKENPFLSRLLSLTSGVVKLKLKIVIATNDESTANVDSAVTREGRMFGAVGFGKLTPEQANAARAVIGKAPAEFTEDVPLARALNEATRVVGKATLESNTRQAFGFTGATKS